MSLPSATEWMWIGLTVGSYAAARWLHAKSPAGLRRAVPPLLMGLAVLSGVVFAAAGGDSGPARAGGSWLVWGLVPATVALALPLTQSAALWRQAPRVVAGVVAGVAVNIAWTTLVCRWWEVAPVIEASLRPKTATAAIALVCAQSSGGLASMGAAFAVLCGLLGSWLYPLVFRKGCSALALGVAVGTVAHGIGTSRLANEAHPPDADGVSAPGASAFAMALSGCCTALLVWPWMG